MNDRETSCIPRTSFLVSALKKTKTSKKEGKHALDQVSKIQETTRTIKEGRRKWKTQIRIKHLALASFFFLRIFNLVESTNDRNDYKWLKVKFIVIS